MDVSGPTSYVMTADEPFRQASTNPPPNSPGQVKSYSGGYTYFSGQVLRMTDPENIPQYEERAKEKVNLDRAFLWNYISYGTGVDRRTLTESKLAFKRYWLQPQVLTVKSKPSTWTTVLGSPIRIPICISPTAAQVMISSPDGDIQTGNAASRASTLMVYSSASGMKIEKFGSIVPHGLYWAQTYLFHDRRNTLHIVRNAERFGFKALVVTVDTPVDFLSGSGRVDAMDELLGPSCVDVDMNPNLIYLNGKKRENRIYGDTELWHAKHGIGNQELYCYATWEDFAWLKTKAARQAIKAGVDGILVSAHGGRQLAGVPAPLDALPDVIKAVKGSNVEVYMDGGIRSGSDVFKALALGARAVFIGRPPLWGLAVNGEDGVRRVLQILEEELTTTMTMCGCASLQDIDSSFVKHESQFKSML
ncbi:Hydroxyacid oxidase 1 [Holothuria leucospilota]|uniref:(S)-2-hydroxy-acid oxidase n=1 Tax=Holothuria leucospilota TaxID=206669 RepID=A0A9Q0YQY6_HOLLE|nr:Hydroxyacid oxidase 1 [Holothuria leucospilota]